MGPVTVGRNDIRAFLLSPGTASIDSLTRKQTHGALHDKPLMGDPPCAWCYSGVCSRGQTDYARGISGSRMVKSITVPTLREAVRELADDVNSGRCPGRREHLSATARIRGFLNACRATVFRSHASVYAVRNPGCQPAALTV
jgi:hypothetical protein